MGQMDRVLERIFRNDPNIGDEVEQATHLWVAGITLGLVLFIVAVNKGLGGSAAM